MKSRNLFLDANVYIEKQYNFEAKIFERISHLTNFNSIQLLVSKIIINEVMENGKRHLTEEVSRFNSSVQKMSLVKRVSKTSVPSGLSSDEEKELVENFVESLEDFFFSYRYTVLDDYLIDTRSVFHTYFKKHPPFSSKKKHEFPDAFVLLSIERWADRNQEFVAVVSKDKDWIDFCNKSKSLHHYETLEGYVGEYNKHEEKLTNKVLGIVGENEEWLGEILIDFILGFDFHFESSEVDGVSCESFDMYEVNMIAVSEAEVYIDVIFDLTITGDVTDYDRYGPAGITSVSTSMNYAVGVTAVFDEKMENIEEWKDLELNSGNGFDLCEERFPYK
jgi:hypothetical protein